MALAAGPMTEGAVTVGPITVAIVGTGPTGIYAFKALLDQTRTAGAPPSTIWLFEKGDQAGVGMPYSAQTADRSMLANIASIEIPPLTQSYLGWMTDQPAAVLRRFGLDPDDLDDRRFTPRLLLGRYFSDELMALVRLAEAAGHRIELRERCGIVDVQDAPGGIRLIAADGPVEALFDRVILATGHVFPADDAADAHYFPSPWSGLLDAHVPACRVGVLGTSLSAIDAAMAVAGDHGRFRRGPGGALRYVPSSEGLAITLMSRTGVLPEADFYCPIPYDPLAVMTPARIAALRGADRLLDRVFDLFRDELRLADPAYAEAVGLDRLDADSFADAYFARRKGRDPFDWARENLAEVERNKAARITVPWRYAILRMHEAVQELVEDFPDEDQARFDRGLKKVFVDNYAAVPSESIRRLLALHEAGVLTVIGIGDDYDLTRGEAGTSILAHGERLDFDVFIDARGQKPLRVADLPFPTLRDSLLNAGAALVEVDEDYALIAPQGFAGRVMFGSAPFLMHDHPFAQGITASAAIGARMARAVLCPGGPLRRRRQTWAA